MVTPPFCIQPVHYRLPRSARSRFHRRQRSALPPASIGKIKPLFTPSRPLLPLVPAPRPPALAHAWPARGPPRLMPAAGPRGGRRQALFHRRRRPPCRPRPPPAGPPARWRGSGGTLAQPAPPEGGGPCGLGVGAGPPAPLKGGRRTHRGDGTAMELPLLPGQACNLAIRLHKMMEHVTANRYITIQYKEIGRFIL